MFANFILWLLNSYACYYGFYLYRVKVTRYGSETGSIGGTDKFIYIIFVKDKVVKSLSEINIYSEGVNLIYRAGHKSRRMDHYFTDFSAKYIIDEFQDPIEAIKRIPSHEKSYLVARSSV